MGKIYKGQTALRIQLETSVDITDSTVTKIKYIKPDNSTGDWSAEIEDYTNGIIYYDLINITDLDQEGEWKLWAFITFSDGRSAPGEVFSITVHAEGE